MKKGRLTTPMVREGDRLVPSTWEHALDRAADGLRRARDDHGPDSVGMFSCSKATNGQASGPTSAIGRSLISAMIPAEWSAATRSGSWHD